MDKPIVISTIGDSLTEGSGKESILSENPVFPYQYQNYLYAYLKEQGVNCIVKNYGIGGQIVGEICSRFEHTIPADFVALMGGTNDVWRYADVAEGIENEICEATLELYEDVIYKAIKTQEESEEIKPIILVCSIPPFGDVKSLPKNGQNSLLYINSEIKKWVEAQNNPNIRFCDVHGAMENEKKYMKDGLAIMDGVHFTTEGNKECGLAIARSIHAILQKK